jgi:hypothetical protein
MALGKRACILANTDFAEAATSVVNLAMKPAGWASGVVGADSFVSPSWGASLGWPGGAERPARQNPMGRIESQAAFIFRGARNIDKSKLGPGITPAP